MGDPFQNQNLPATQARKKSTNLLWLILGGIFLLVIILCILIIFCFKNKTTDKLIQFAPIDSIVYVSARDSLLPWSNYNISLLPFSQFYNQTKNLFGLNENQFKDEVLNNVSQVAFILLSNTETKDLDSVFIFKTKKSLLPFCDQCKKQKEKVESILNKQPNYLKIEDDIIVVATSLQALEKIKKVVDKNIFSLELQVEERRKNFDLLYFYLSADNLKVYFESRGESQSIFNNYFAVHNIYSGLKRKNNQWQFQINYPVKSINHSPLVEYLPSNFSFYANGINLLTIFSSWTKVDQNLVETFTQTAESFKSIYNFDVNGFSSSFLNQPIDLIIFKSLKSSAFGFEYVLVAPKPTSDEVNNLENLIKIILAQKIPDEVDYFLPDGSKVTELLARPESWQWQNKQLDSGLIISYLSEPALDFEIAYLIKEEKIFIASSINQLEIFINNEEVKLSDLFLNRKQVNVNESFLLFNQEEIFSFPNYFLPKGIISVQEGGSGAHGYIMD